MASYMINLHATSPAYIYHVIIVEQVHNSAIKRRP